MVLEIADISARPGTEDDFVETLRTAASFLDGAAGLRTLRIVRGIESDTRFILLIEWDSVEAHQKCAATPEFAKFREMVSPFFDGSPRVEHFADVAL